MRAEIFLVLEIKIAIFLIMKFCSLVGGDHFVGSCCLHFRVMPRRWQQ